MDEVVSSLRPALGQIDGQTPESAGCGIAVSADNEAERSISFFLSWFGNVGANVFGGVDPGERPGKYDVHVQRPWGDGASQTISEPCLVEKIVSLIRGFMTDRLPDGAVWDDPRIEFVTHSVARSTGRQLVSGISKRRPIRLGDVFTSAYSRPPEGPIGVKRRIHATVDRISRGGRSLDALPSGESAELLLSGETGVPLVAGDRLVGRSSDADELEDES